MPRRRSVRSILVVAAVITISSPAHADDSAALRSLRSAHGFLQRGMVQSAIPEYESALDGGLTGGTRDEALYGLSVCLVRTAQWDRALASLDAIGGGDGFAFADDAAVLHARCSMMKEDFGAAAERLTPILERPAPGPLAPSAWSMRVECLYRAGDPDGAIGAWKAGAQRWGMGDGASASYFAARALDELGRTPEAIGLLESIGVARADDPLNDHRALLLARCYAGAGRDSEAMAIYRSVADRAEAALASDAMLAMSRLCERDPREAERWLRRIIEEHASTASAPIAEIDLSRLLLDAGETEEARALATHARTAGGAAIRSDAERLLARCDLESGKPEKAAERLRVLATDAAGDPSGATQYDLGVAEWRAGHLDRAMAALTSAAGEGREARIRADAAFALIGVAHDGGDAGAVVANTESFATSHPKDPRVSNAWLLAGAACERSQDYAGAERAYTSAMSTGKGADRDGATLRLGLLRHRQGRADEARDMLMPLGETRDRVMAPALLALGDLLMTDGANADAARVLARYLELTRDEAGRADAMLMLGTIEAARGGHERAVEWFGRVIREWGSTPTAAHAPLVMATSLDALGRADEADNQLGEASRSPDASVALAALRRLGARAEERGDEVGAAGYYARAAELDTGAGRAEALLRAADASREAGDVGAAESAFDRVIRDDPEGAIGAEAAARRGLMRLADGRVVEGRGDLEAAIVSLAPGALRDAVQVERARAMRAGGDLERAAITLREVADASEDASVRVSALYELAGTQTEAEQLDAAAATLAAGIAALRAMGDAAPEELAGATHYLAASNALARQKYTDAVDLTDGFDDRFGASALTGGVSLVRGEALLRLGRFAQAADAFVPAAEDADPAFARAGMLKRGDALASAQRWEESELVFRGFEERFPADELWFQAAFGIGWAMENRGRPEQAIETYRRVVDGHDGATAARAQFQIGECLYGLGRLDEAARELLKVDILFTSAEWSAAALYEAGRCMNEAGDGAGARARFAEVIERFGGSRWAGPARKELGLLGEVSGD